MRYRIGKISKLIGVTTESLRNYQRLGIIEPRDDRYSAYKCFDPISVGKLLAMRKLQTMGCRLADVSQSMKEYSLPRYMETLRAKLSEAKNRLEYQKRLIERMESHLAFSEAVQRSSASSVPESGAAGSIRLETSPAYYCFDYFFGDSIRMEDANVDQFVQWTQHMLFVLNYSPCSPEVLLNGTSPVKIGLAVEEKYAVLLDLDVSPPVYFRPARRSVVCSMRHRFNGKAIGDTAASVSSFLADRGLTADEGAFYVNEISYHQDDEEFFYSRVFIPVR